MAAIVGYTNAGKSTLLNQLSGADVLVEDMLFATLDPTTRRVGLPGGKEILFTDTVGFIQKLPTQLVAAFQATLEGIREADVIVHVIDIADRNLWQKVTAVEDVLTEIDAAGKPLVIALNKVDLIEPAADSHAQEGRFAMRRDVVLELRERYADVAPISAQQGVGIEELLEMIENLLVREMVEVDVVLPYRAGELLALWHKQGIVACEEYGETGIRVRGRLPKWVEGIIADQM